MARKSDIYSIPSAAAYLGVSPDWIRQLARKYRETDGKEGLRYWQEVEPTAREDGRVTHGSPLMFKRAWLDSYAASRREHERLLDALAAFKASGGAVSDADAVGLVERGWLMVRPAGGWWLTKAGRHALKGRRGRAESTDENE